MRCYSRAGPVPCESAPEPVLAGISPLQLICHRIVWSLLLLLVLIGLPRAKSRGPSDEWRALWDAIRVPRVVGVYTVAAVAIAVNWLIFVWAVSVNQIVQISLGYFINPLLSVVLGMLFFHERLRLLVFQHPRHFGFEVFAKGFFLG